MARLRDRDGPARLSFLTTTDNMRLRLSYERRWLCVAVLCLSACSFGVRGLRADYDGAVHGEPRCDQQSGGRQIVDTLLSIGGLVATATLITKTLNDDIGRTTGIALTSVAIAGTGTAIAAISVARSRTASCQRAVRLYHERQRRRDPTEAPDWASDAAP